MHKTRFPYVLLGLGIILLYAIRKIITDKGEPCGTLLCSGKTLENSLLMRIVIFLLDIKLATYLIIF